MRKLIGISLSIALGLTGSTAISAAAGQLAASGGGNWQWSFGADGGTNYVKVNARNDGGHPLATDAQ